MRPSVLLAVLAVLAGCGSRTGLEESRDASVMQVGDEVAPPAGCGPATCAGCCDDAGACQTGDAQASCGEQGRACVACDLRQDEICNPQPGQPDERVCWAPCDPRYCMGGCCLPSGACIRPPTDEACGSTGTVCTDCTATGQTCGTAAPGLRGCVGP